MLRRRSTQLVSRIGPLPDHTRLEVSKASLPACIKNHQKIVGSKAKSSDEARIAWLAGHARTVLATRARTKQCQLACVNEMHSVQARAPTPTKPVRTADGHAGDMWPPAATKTVVSRRICVDEALRPAVDPEFDGEVSRVMAGGHCNPMDVPWVHLRINRRWKRA